MSRRGDRDRARGRVRGVAHTPDTEPVADGHASLMKLNQKGKPMTQHPEIHAVDAVCATCGTSFALRSTAAALSVDVCANCHPAYTGAERTVIGGSRVERFNRRRSLAAA